MQPQVQVQIQVDVREQELIEKLKTLIETIPSFKEIELKIETLPLGDIILSNKEEELVILERKSVNDFIASIKDGRYEEQSYRLNGLDHPNHNIMYLIEGDLNRVNRFRDTRIEKLTLYSAIFSLNYTKGFSVIRTFSLEESAIFICNSAMKLRKNLLENKKPYYPKISLETTKIIDQEPQLENQSQLDEEKISSDKDYVNVVKKIKKENVTPDNIAEIMLSQIPGISSVTALAIMEKYHTLSELLQALQENQECLKDLCYQTGKGQTRKINKTCIENIQKYLLKK
jgi:crossover junction endonuclease MUS81